MFKFRKARNARAKGKADTAGFGELTDAQVLAEVAGGPGSADDKRTARNFARRDGEHQTIGRIPARFMQYSDRANAPHDSDSDDEDTDHEG